MKRSIYWKRLLGLLLAAALFTTQTGFTFVVSFAVEEVGRQLPSFASSELTVVEPVESAQSTETPAEEPETPPDGGAENPTDGRAGNAGRKLGSGSC